jgi:hypothetical protein
MNSDISRLSAYVSGTGVPAIEAYEVFIWPRPIQAGMQSSEPSLDAKSLGQKSDLRENLPKCISSNRLS